jgi:hypothetical protein
LGSVPTAAGQRNVAGFPAIRAIVEAVGAKAHVHLSLADGAISFAGAAIFRQVALRAKGLTLHESLYGKLYLSRRGCGKAKVERARRVVYLVFGTSFGRTTISLLTSIKAVFD